MPKPPSRTLAPHVRAAIAAAAQPKLKPGQGRGGRPLAPHVQAAIASAAQAKAVGPELALARAGTIQRTAIDFAPGKDRVGPARALQCAAEQAPANPAQNALGLDSISKTHDEHGQVMVLRHPKDAGADSVKFSIFYTAKDSNSGPIEYSHTMDIKADDGGHGNRSTLGYWKIFMPAAMTGKGIGYIYHYVAARAARDLGVDYLVVDNVTTEAMTGTVTRLGMTDVGAEVNSFHGDPAAVETAAANALANKGWQ